jgi:hypothetical protein
MCTDNKPAPPSYNTATSPEGANATPEEVKSTLNVEVPQTETPYDEASDATIDKEDERLVNESAEQPITPSSVAAGAAAVGFTTGYLVAGPIIGLAGAAGGFYAANSSGRLGDAAKAVGTGAIKGFRKTKELCKEHQVGSKAKAAWARAVEKTKEVNDRYKISEKSREAALAAGRECKKINDTYDITGKAQRGLTKGLEKIAGTKQESISSASDATTTNERVNPAAQPAPSAKLLDQV